MITISIMIEGQDGLNWPRWKGLVAAVERLGFGGLYRSDHFTNPQPPDEESLELIVSLTYVADRSSRITFGALVSPASFREPVMLTRQIAALDDLSGGRAILGLGAGWQEREHRAFGYELGDVATRMARLEEALEVSALLLRHEGPASYQGRFYQLHEAQISPRRSGTRILVGGNGPKRTLPLVARYADVWNGVGLAPETFRQRSGLLDDLLRDRGRDPGSLRRTMMTGLIFGRDQTEFEANLRRFSPPEVANLPFEELLTAHRNKGWYAPLGTPEMVQADIAALEKAGVEELMLQWYDFDDLEALEAFAQAVL